MDANSRSTLWDDKCAGIAQSCRSLQMGAKLEEMIHRFSLQIHNSGVSTYYSGNSSTTPDVTLSRGIIHYDNICWSTIDDDLNSPHLGILMNIGHKRETVRKRVIDWPNFDCSGQHIVQEVVSYSANSRISGQQTRACPLMLWLMSLALAFRNVLTMLQTQSLLRNTADVDRQSLVRTIQDTWKSGQEMSVT